MTILELIVEIDSLKEENNNLKEENKNLNDIINNNITKIMQILSEHESDMEELKQANENRQTEIGILQDHDYEVDLKIENITNTENTHTQDINDLSIDLSQLSCEVKINITDVKNDLSSQIADMVIAPIGTIVGWSPVPEIGSENNVSIPNCWVTCDGSLIKEGPWIGQHSPDLNKANRQISTFYIFDYLCYTLLHI